MPNVMFKSAFVAAALAASFGLSSGDGASAADRTAPGGNAARSVQAGMIGGAVTPPDITGVWITDDGLGAVEIAPCGEKRCGRIVWMKNLLGKDGHPQRDVNNPDEELRARPVCGVEILQGLIQQRDKSWDSGKIYDPKEGDTYDLAVKLKSPNELEVTGYEGTKWLSETFIWKRSLTELARCDRAAGSH